MEKIEETLDKIKHMVSQHKNLFLLGLHLPDHLISIPKTNNNARVVGLALVLIAATLEQTGDQMPEGDRLLLTTARDCLVKLGISKELIFDEEEDANPPS